MIDMHQWTRSGRARIETRTVLTPDRTVVTGSPGAKRLTNVFQLNSVGHGGAGRVRWPNLPTASVAPRAAGDQC